MTPLSEWKDNDVQLHDLKTLHGDIRVIHGYTAQLLKNIAPRIEKWHPNQRYAVNLFPEIMLSMLILNTSFLFLL